MEQAGVSMAIQQLAYQGAPIVVYLVGVILGLALLGRHRGPAILVLLGSGLLLLTTVSMVGLQAYLFQVREQQAWSHSQFATIMGAIGIVGSVLRAIALAMFLAAAFVGRRSPVHSKPFKEPF
jgi:hypothetical protein